MKYSPKLKRVIAKIKEIIKKEDLAGCVVLVEPGFSEYINVIDPSFSVAFFDNAGIRMKTKGLPLTPAQKKKKLETTSIMFHLLATTMMQQGLTMAEVSEFLDSKLEIEHGPGTHTSQEEIDN